MKKKENYKELSKKKYSVIIENLIADIMYMYHCDRVKAIKIIRKQINRN